jgi:hypothetical protein
VIPEDVFVREVEHALEMGGRWETYGEYRMGAGPTVSVILVQSGGRTIYRAESTWMAWVFTVTGDYDSLDRARPPDYDESSARRDHQVSAPVSAFSASRIPSPTSPAVAAQCRGTRANAPGSHRYSSRVNGSGAVLS